MTCKEEIAISHKKDFKYKISHKLNIPNKRYFIVILKASVIIYVLYFDEENIKILTFHNPQNTHN